MLYQPKIVAEAAPDFYAMRTGTRRTSAHPLAEQLTGHQIGLAYGALHARVMPHHNDQQIFALGIATTQFSRLLAESQMVPVQRAYEAQAAHLRFTSSISVDNYMPTDLLGPMDPVIELEPVNELAQISSFLGVKTGTSIKGAKLERFARLVGFSEQAIVNDSLDDVSRFIRDLGVSAARKECKMVCEALESNPTDEDAVPLFDSALLNVLAEPLTAPHLGTALSYLRKQRLPNGGLSDLAARHLIVAADLEMTARDIVSNAGLEIEIQPQAHLPDGRWYVLANPEVQPVVGVLRLRGTENPVRVDQTKRPINYDGAWVRVRADLGAVLVSSVGIVRGGTV
ncbi:hypothetical protein [Hydrogenophaga sp.]|uniref:phage major capsid protein n=1 Tax=Hydrogenophaga sp. TaxID=1904254 RepID=UPI002ABC1B90|nr:hypothetical protein [Hydrogenophaga sp.]MDZ4397979.1 hypothetical protein [Hydrogenophaga sp.]